jgi:hypothetical protein
MVSRHPDDAPFLFCAQQQEINVLFQGLFSIAANFLCPLK